MTERYTKSRRRKNSSNEDESTSPSPYNPFAEELMDPKYHQRVVQSKKMKAKSRKRQNRRWKEERDYG